ncbi:phosphoenolpyruvate carboxykinase (ATP) [Niastella koreensis]|uniref:Phosphoenolpyruvate carboxykinase (ATP) n=2 Tax=Niastella koreensis TaxID=354356 RepID=G8TH96_NIAKG|nr:phosphoenolpyruvate carboxykinase (ATP) [Niastella koreensis]AEW01706.1 Phosphoenolpyruvate carboxykinase (ATP) [Niastella koreensis GR20-10]OQP48415.1 phosphoenolpyruvate carboxykinase (ATP) [Niastella koreensis]
MSLSTIAIPTRGLEELGLRSTNTLHYQLSAEELVHDTLRLNQGELNNTGALVVKTGEFTGRSPKDKFIVKDEITENSVHWNDFNIPLEEKYFHCIHKKILDYLNEQPEVWVRDSYACADPRYRLNIRVINDNPWANLFANNMFMRPEEEDLENFNPEWHILAAPGLHLDAKECGVRQHNAAVISFKHRTILIAGSAYTGEIKKGIFSILNYILPHDKGVLSMHCSANIGQDGDTALFFGLSGTGKTTLSADPNRKLIGDDEHGWTDNGVFNFEGGCYAKCIDLSQEKEPAIYAAIRGGALVENTNFYPATNEIDFANKTITENTRVSYPLHYICNAIEPAQGGIPENIFFLTCDAYGVLPPVSRLTPAQAMYQFISGYTAKVAGTEAGVTEPKSTFSACFGAPFLPLHPGQYAAMLGEKLRKHNVKVWLINTGWTGGAYGTGSRMKLSYTRAMISAALDGKLDSVEYEMNPVFGMAVPTSCPGVPEAILNPRNTWADKTAYDKAAESLAKQFITNFEKYASGVSPEVLAAAPKI